MTRKPGETFSRAITTDTGWGKYWDTTPPQKALYPTPPPGVAYDDLVAMLSYKRPAGSRTENKFRRRFLYPLGMDTDTAGNITKVIGDAPKVLWSCHTDTVHKTAGRQEIYTKDGFLQSKGKECLGADDTVGVWLMREMIKAGKPGLYIFHYGEEIGGVGSRYIASNRPQLLEGINHAIALDRKGYGDVITHQMGRCCSDEFAKALAAQLGGDFKSAHGIFTDTANYTGIVPECTNLSVGYFSQHWSTEKTDPGFAQELLGKLLALDVDSLPIAREPKRYDFEGIDDIDWEKYGYGATKERAIVPYTRKFFGAPGSLVALVEDHPQLVADILESYGFDTKSLEEEILQRGGVIKKGSY